MAETPTTDEYLAADDDRAPGGTVLLIVDMINDWRFPEAEDLLPQTLQVARRIAALRARCRERRIPVIYANDNQGRWRSDFRALVERSLARGGTVREITETLRPHDDDYFVLKPKHSAFFATPLELLLQHLAARRLIVAGVAADQCVLATAVDAKMRDYEVIVPPDCIASPTAERSDRAVQHLSQVLKLDTTPSTELALPGSAPPGD